MDRILTETYNLEMGELFDNQLSTIKTYLIKNTSLTLKVEEELYDSEKLRVQITQKMRSG